jgi:flagellar motility protein MotE (MotC chaperone)
MRVRPLLVIVAALAATGALRAGLAVQDAPSSLASLDRLFGSLAQASGSPPAPAAVPPATPAASPAAVVPEEMLRAIAEERAQLALQKEALARRAAEIDLAREKLEIEQGRLSELKTVLENLLARVAGAQTADVGRLVALYSNMKPKEAAAIMNDLDIEVTVMVLGTMPERDAAPILANLDIVRAQAISRIILERSKLPGDQRLDNLKF